MATTPTSPETLTLEPREHRETYHRFSKLVLFGVLHVALVLACLAVAFPGHAPATGLLLGLGGTLVLMVVFALTP